ncbi:MAG: hypothetical protein KDC83_01760 [Flavobacteriales bacterium]|nr:hypothetical protein [Flavobacteriales bacterium]
MRFSVFAFALFITLSSCKKAEKPQVDLGFDYYPNAIGSQIVYSVDSIVYNSFTLTVDTFKFEIKEVQKEQIKDDGGRDIVVMSRWKNSPKKGWKEVKSWQFYKDNFIVEEQKENLRIVKMNFPVVDGQSWDANVRNTQASQTYRLTGPQSEIILGNSYSEVVIVDQLDESDPLQLQVNRAFEKYAKGVGLVYKYNKSLKRFTTGEPGDVPIDSGLIYIQQIKSHSGQ